MRIIEQAQTRSRERVGLPYYLVQHCNAFTSANGSFDMVDNGKEVGN